MRLGGLRVWLMFGIEKHCDTEQRDEHRRRRVYELYLPDADYISEQCDEHRQV